MPVTYDSISTTTLGSANTTITFSSIPSSYTDLRLVMSGKVSTTGNNIIARLNSDSGTNYSVVSLYGNSSTGASVLSSNNNYLWLQWFSYSDSTDPSLITTDILSYSGSTNKTLISQISTDRDGSGAAEFCCNLWRNTSAINRIDLYVQSSNSFSAGFTATLYGILRA